MLTIRIVDRAEDLEQVSPQWQLLSDREGQTPFQTAQWNMAWWRHVGSFDSSLSLHVVTVSKDSAICAIAPLMVRHEYDTKILKFLSDPYADYLDVIVDSSAVEPGQIYEVLWDYLDRILVSKYDQIELKELPTDSGFLRYLCKRANEDARVIIEKGGECPRLEITDAAAFDRAVNKREYILKQRRLNHMGNLVCAHYTQADEISKRMPHYMRMHLRQWLPKPNRGITFDEPEIVRFYTHFVQTMGPAGLLMLTELVLNDRPIAYYLGFIYNRVYWAYRPAFEPSLARYSPGGVMHRFMLRDLKERGFVTFDFMRGAFAYKYRYANSVSQNKNVRICNVNGSHM